MAGHAVAIAIRSCLCAAEPGSPATTSLAGPRVELAFVELERLDGGVGQAADAIHSVARAALSLGRASICAVISGSADCAYARPHDRIATLRARATPKHCSSLAQTPGRKRNLLAKAPRQMGSLHQ
eukprot:2301543-Prymnesium_polylepis.1